MDFTLGVAMVCIALALLLDFVSLLTTSWFMFSIGQGSIHISGLYQSCTIYGCNIDWEERPLVSQIILFVFAGSLLPILLSGCSTAAAELKSWKVFLFLAAAFGFLGGGMICAATTLYTIRVKQELSSGNLIGIPSYNYGYWLAWTAFALAIISSTIMTVKAIRALYQSCQSTKATKVDCVPMEELEEPMLENNNENNLQEPVY